MILRHETINEGCKNKFTSKKITKIIIIIRFCLFATATAGAQINKKNYNTTLSLRRGETSELKESTTMEDLVA